jgi:hypothetical protein
MRQCLWRCQTVAEFEDVLNLAPIDRASIEPQAEPTSGANIGRKIEVLRVTARTVDVLAQRGLAAHRNDAVAMVVVQEVREDPLPDPKVGVITAQ